MVKSNTLIKIHSKLDSHDKFISNDFTIENKNSNLKVIYNYDRRFYFSVNFPTSKSVLEDGKTERNMFGASRITSLTRSDYEFKGSMLPGEVALHENFNVEGLNIMLSKISEWLNNLWDELTASPALRVVIEQSDEIEEIKKSFDKIEEEKFSKSEAEALIEKLNYLEVQFQEQMEQSSSNKKHYTDALNELHSEIENLKILVFTLKKKSWFKAFGTRIFKWYSKEENRRMLKDGMELIKPLLPEGTDGIEGIGN